MAKKLVCNVESQGMMHQVTVSGNKVTVDGTGHVSAATAVTKSDITALGIPTIFIPSPYVTNNHQYKNALDLVKKDAALMIEEKDLNKISFIHMIDDILADEKRYNEIKKNVSSLGIKDSSTRIYDILKELILDDKKFY